MRIAIIADVFPPLRSSGAVQLRDLALELVRQGHQPTVMIPAYDVDRPWLIEAMNGVEIVRLKAPRTKDVGYVRRTIAEFLMPFAMLKNLRNSPLSDVRWDGIVWYSPTIFLGPIANALKKSNNCKSYLIVRDIFPEWAVDMGLLSRGLPYHFFKSVASYQYSVADVIGVQTPGNLPYFDVWSSRQGLRVEVLHNWLADAPIAGCSIAVANGPLAGRIIFVYAGNMGVAQGMDILLDLAGRLRDRTDIGFLFVGRGSDAKRLRDEAKMRGLDNVVFHDEIDPSEIVGLYAQCHAGIVALDPRHKTHNIPGKFLSYMQSGLPVLANINRGNDLAELIEREGVGRVCVENSVTMLHRLALDMVDELARDTSVAARCKKCSAQLFSPTVAARKIVAALEE
jgi:glycosyltransferase involved in cell wall biosynthesis